MRVHVCVCVCVCVYRWAGIDQQQWPKGLKEELLGSRLWDPKYGDRQVPQRVGWGGRAGEGKGGYSGDVCVYLCVCVFVYAPVSQL